MRPLIIVGLAITAVVAMAGMGLLLLLLLAAIVLATSRNSGHSADLGTYPGSYPDVSANDYSDLYDNALHGNPQPLDRSPADPWLNGNEFGGRMSSGTFDDSGEGNHVISVGGEVLNLP